MNPPAPLAAPADPVSECLRDHAALLDRSQFQALGEDEIIDFVRSNERVIRRLEAVGSAVASRLTELGGLSAEDVFSTVGKHSTGEARRVQRRGGLANRLPTLTRGFLAGTIPTANLDTVASARHKLRHDPAWEAAFDAKDASMTRKASRMNPKRFAGWIRDLVDRISDDGQTEQQSDADKNSFRSWTNSEGRWQARLDLDPMAGEKFQNAIDGEARSLAKQATLAGETAHHGENLNATAACSLVDSASGTKGRPSINVVVDLDTLRHGPWDGTIKRTGGGNNISLPSLHQFLCDAWITHTVLHEDGRALAVGRKYRTATDAQRDALRIMYQTCAMCEVQFDHCEIHHIIEWEHHGPTDLNNLIPLCSVHHQRIHHGWQLKLDDQRNLHCSRPDGRHWKTLPLPSAASCRARHEYRQRKRAHERQPSTTD
ncbi:MAG: DUF222 domain-containing protein [Acidimicrobiales bacterium]|nr:DUF222 domain-containing protein [Acidimicrobiales bacterium]